MQVKKRVVLGVLSAIILLCGGCVAIPTESKAAESSPPLPESGPASSESAGDNVPEGIGLEQFYREYGAMTYPSDQDFLKYLEQTIPEKAETSGSPFDSPGLVYLPGLWDTQENALYVTSSSEKEVKSCWGVDCVTGDVYQWEPAEGGIRPGGAPEQLPSPAAFSDQASALSAIQNRFWDPAKFTPPIPLLFYGETGETGPYYESEHIPLENGGYSIYRMDADHEEPYGYVIHAYETVVYPDESHTATANWYTVYKNGFVTDLTGNTWILSGNPTA